MILKDIISLKDLEQYAAEAASKEFSNEISRIVDVSMILDEEYETFDRSPSREKYSGPHAFFTAADSSSFLSDAGHEAHVHRDGMYGWSTVLTNPCIEQVDLHCSHTRIFTHKESLM